MTRGQKSEISDQILHVYDNFLTTARAVSS